MIAEFEILNEEERELMFKAPILVSILIAGADNKFEKSELKKAVTISQNRKNAAREGLIEFYQMLSEGFEDKLMVTIQNYPIEAKDRTPLLVEELAGLNAVLPKLEKVFAIEYYESIRDIAKKIASASGGVLGYMAIGFEESKLVDLHMVNNPA